MSKPPPPGHAGAYLGDTVTGLPEKADNAGHFTSSKALPVWHGTFSLCYFVLVFRSFQTKIFIYTCFYCFRNFQLVFIGA